MRRRRVLLALVACALVAVATLPATAGPAVAEGSHALIQGSGSSWSANAIDQWIADVHSNGLQVVFTPNGSAQGRKDFAYGTTDFAITEIGYQGNDPLTNEADTSQGRDYAYLPVVSGGTAFPYQIRVKGQLVRNLRLSGLTLAKIFTNQITNWSDPAITRDNNGNQLPSLPIIPVIHSEGSGSSAHFSEYLADEYPDLWRSFSGRSTFTEYYPREGNAIGQSGSDGVMNFIASNAANGAIGFDEYSYALGKDYPVAKVENAAGYYTLPTQYNVAVALTQAIINQDQSSPNYLLQDLHDVFTDSDSRAYPLSSYSYGILPTASNDKKLKASDTAFRQSLADFFYYSICDGQKEIGPIGYSALPINLVQAGFAQIAKLQQADPNVDLTNRDVSTCHNPTFIAGQPDRNYLAEIAPAVPDCDRDGRGPCVDADAGADPSTSAAKPHPDAQTTSGVLASQATAAARSGAATTASGQLGAGLPAATSAAVASSTGLSGQAAVARTAGQADRAAKISSRRDSVLTTPLAAVVVLLVLLLFVAPAGLAWALDRRPQERP